MNPVAVTIMLGLLAAFGAVIVYALVTGSTWLLAGLAVLIIGLFIKWG